MSSREVHGKAPREKRLILIVLLCVLAVLALALAWDFLRARPAVKRAYETVAKMNESMNRAAIKDSPDATKRPGFDSPTTQDDVRRAIGRTPRRLVDYGPYKVEVYSWTAGIPWRTHDYYVVYERGDNRLLLLKHYPFTLPEYEGNSVYVAPDAKPPKHGPVYGSVQGDSPPDRSRDQEDPPPSDDPAANVVQQVQSESETDADPQEDARP